MRDQLKLESVVKTIKAAFRPLECVVELYDFQHRIRFRVFSPDDKPLLTMREYLTRRALDPGSLSVVLNECRARIEPRGISSNPGRSWHDIE